MYSTIIPMTPFFLIVSVHGAIITVYMLNLCKIPTKCFWNFILFFKKWAKNRERSKSYPLYFLDIERRCAAQGGADRTESAI